MNASALQSWIDRMGFENREAAAAALGLSLSGLLKQLNGQRAVSAQTARIATLLEQQTQDERVSR